MADNFHMLKQGKIILALRLLYLVVGIGVLHTAITTIRHAEVRSPYFLLSVKLTVYAISVFIIYQVGNGKNWARWLLVVIFAICLPLVILPAISSFFHNPLVSTMEFLQVAMSLVAFGILFVSQESKSLFQE